MKAAELFAGIGGFRIASDRFGLDTVWANDVCPKASEVYRRQFGAAELCEGDLRAATGSIPPHDLLTGGFPCQPFSSAGKKRGVRDPRGTLFQAIIDVLAAHKPRRFVLENVKRLLTMENGAHFATILASLAALDYRLEWRLLNAMHFGLPQNRQRVFIVGVRTDGPTEPIAARLASKSDVEAGGVVGLPALAEWARIENHAKSFPTWGLAADGRFVGANLTAFSAATPVVPVSSILQARVGAEFDFTEATLGWLPNNTPVNKFVQGVEILSNQAGGARMGYTIFGVNGVAPTLTSTTSRHYERYKIGGRYRRLTNVEYARIQGFPDDHCAACSVYDQYALYGNAVPPPMAEWAIRRALSAGIRVAVCPKAYRQAGLFDNAAYTRQVSKLQPSVP